MVLYGLVIALIVGTVQFPGASLAADLPQAGALYPERVLVVDPGMHTALVSSAAVDADGRWAVSGSYDKTIRVWSLADGALAITIRLPAGPGNIGKVYAVAVSPDGAMIAAGGWTRWTTADPQEQIYFFDRASGALIKRISGLPAVVQHLAFSPDGRRLAATLGNNGIRLYDRDRGWDESARDADSGADSYGADFAPDGRLATTALDGKVRLYTAETKGTVRPTVVRNSPGGGQPYGIAFSPDGTRLAIGYADATAVTLLDGQTLETLPGPDLGEIANGDLSKVAWSRDGQTLFAAGSYGSVQGVPVLAWRDAGSGARRTLSAGQETVVCLVSLPDSGLLVVAQGPWFAQLGREGLLRWAHPPAIADFRGQFDRLSVSGDGTRVGFAAFGKQQARFDLTTRTLALDPPGDAQMATPRQDLLPTADWRNGFRPTLGGRQLSLQEYRNIP